MAVDPLKLGRGQANTDRRHTPEARNLAGASRAVEADRLGLARAGLKPHGRIPALRSGGFKHQEHAPCGAAASELQEHEHAFDLAATGLKRAEGTAAYRLAVGAGDQ